VAIKVMNMWTQWTRLAACQDLAPHGGAPAAVGAYSSYCSLQSTPSAISACQGLVVRSGYQCTGGVL
jgi:hypothetical protein